MHELSYDVDRDEWRR